MPKPTCELCRQRVLVKESAWISHWFGFQVHFDCMEPGWYRDILERRAT